VSLSDRREAEQPINHILDDRYGAAMKDVIVAPDRWVKIYYSEGSGA
jgi:hypothetical protein